MLELFANFDCDIGQKDVCARIMESLSSIAQGRFQRSDHSSVITPQQEQSLRRQALEILVKILRNLNRTIDAEVKLEAIAAAKLAESRQERAQEMISNQHSDLKLRDEDDSNSKDGSLMLTDQDADAESKKPSDEGFSTVQASDNMGAKQ